MAAASPLFSFIIPAHNEERWIGNSRLDPVILERLREVAGAEGQPA